MRTDFSIRTLLSMEETGQQVSYPWLLTSRYHPPNLPRRKKRGSGKRRQRSRAPRVPFSASQLSALEVRFKHHPYVTSQDAAQLALLLCLSEARIKIWFQNRRARERRIVGKDWRARDPGKEAATFLSYASPWSAFYPYLPAENITNL